MFAVVFAIVFGIVLLEDLGEKTSSLNKFFERGMENSLRQRFVFAFLPCGLTMSPLKRKWKGQYPYRIGLTLLSCLLLGLTPQVVLSVPLLVAASPASGLFNRPTASENRAVDSRILFEQNCTLCHTQELVQRKTAGWDRNRIRSALDNLNRLNPAMPDYKGTSREKDRLADYIFRLNNCGRPQPER
jgi:hypothetical protein